eukprot:gene6241-8596_t
MGRDGSKGKKSGRGSGRKMFIANEEELALRDREIASQKDARARRRAGSDEEVEGVKKTSGNDESDDEIEQNTKNTTDGTSVFNFERKSRAELQQLKQKAPIAEEDDEEDEDELPKGLLSGMQAMNPNHMKKPVEKMLKVKNINEATGPVDPEAGLTRKEKEALAAAKAKEEYQRRYMAGETEQAKKDLERLALVRARREAAAKQRELEGRKPGMSATGIESSSSGDEDDDSDEDDSNLKAFMYSKCTFLGLKSAGVPAPTKAPTAPPLVTTSAAIAAKKKAAAAETVTESSDGPEKLKAMDIKKMNGDTLKEHLKERKLDVQGQKKDLMKRLLDYEAARP